MKRSDKIQQYCNAKIFEWCLVTAYISLHEDTNFPFPIIEDVLY